MVASPPSSRRVWVLPIVVVFAALVAVPANAAILGPVAHASLSADRTTAPSLRTAPSGGGSLPLLGETPALRTLSNPLVRSTTGVTDPVPTGPASLSSLRSLSGSSLLGALNVSAALARVNATFAGVPGAAAEAAAARLVAEGAVPPSVAYLPNLHLFTQPTAATVVSPYNSSPAPMGLADFGLSAGGPYSVSTPGVLGGVTLNSYNATAGAFYEDTGAYYYDDLSPTVSVTPWQSGLQLNTVVDNVSYPGSNAGSFWTQNVVDFSGDQLQFVDNVWNFTGPNASDNASTLFSYNGTWVVGDFYYDLGPTLPVTFPLTIQLYNNASIRDGRTAVTFGYRVVEGATVYQGIYDTVVFNSLPTGADPLRTPDFLIDGNKPAYTEGPYQGPLYDAELVFGGPGDGTNAQVNSLNGTMSLEYQHGTGWTPARATYDYGGDTGETAIGVASTWTGSTEYLSQGPSILYGLWNTSGAVPHGSFHLTLSNDPGYGFYFVGLDGTSDWNLSFAPTDAASQAETELPPGLAYNLTYAADGYNAVDAPISGIFTQAGAYTSASFTPTANAASWTTPIYLDGDSQAEDLATHALGWTSGAYTFQNRELNVSPVFNHLNDWGFPEFDLFWAYDVSNALVVNDLVQGPDTQGGVCSASGVPATCYLSQVPFGYENLPDYGSEIAAWSVSGPTFEDLELYGYTAPIGLEVGGAVSLWNVTDASVYETEGQNGSFGVWAASSPDLYDDYSEGLDAAALTLLDSPDAYGYQIAADDFGEAVLAEGSPDGFFQYVQAQWFSVGYEEIDSNATTVVDSTANLLSYGAGLFDSNNTLLLGVDALDGSTGCYGQDVGNVTVGYVSAVDDSTGVDLEGANDSYLEAFTVNDSEGAYVSGGVGLYADAINASADSVGVEAEQVSQIYVGDVLAETDSLGTILLQSGNATVLDVEANDSLGVLDFASPSFDAPVYVAGVSVSNGGVGVGGEFVAGLTVVDVGVNPGTLGTPTIGVEVEGAFYVNVTDVLAIGAAAGVAFVGVDLSNVNDVVADSEAVGVVVAASEYDTVSEVAAYASSPSPIATIAVSVNDSESVNVTGVTAAGPTTLGANLTGSEAVAVSDVTVTEGGVGVQAYYSYEVTVANVSASDQAAIGVETFESTDLWIANVSAEAAVAVIAEATQELWVTNVSVSTSNQFGVAVVGCSAVWVNDTSATDTALGVLALGSDAVYVTNTTVSGLGSVGVVLAYSDDSSVNTTTAELSAVAVGLQGGASDRVTGVVASAPSLASPWGPAAPIPGAPIAAVVTLGTIDDTISGVVATTVPVGLYDDDSTDLTVSQLNATGGDFAVILNGTAYGFLDRVDAYHDVEGVQMNAGAFTNVVTAGSFQDDGSYGVDIESGSYNVVYNNDFVGDNGATTVYNAAHVQAFSASPTNAFNDSAEIGNFWADWHTYLDGVLAPYYVGTGAWDDHPLGAPEGMTTVTFTSSGLAPGTSWSVTLGGVTQSTVGTTIVFDEFPGSYAFTVPAVSGWRISQTAGSVVVTTGPVSVSIGFAAEYTVTFSETGLPGGTSWTVYFNGVDEFGPATTFAFSAVAGTYQYVILAPAGWAASPASGTITVGDSYLVPVTFSTTVLTPPPTYTVTIEETGLPTGTSWSAIFNGVQETTTGASLTFTGVAAGTYAYQVLGVSGYTASPGSGSATVGGAYTIVTAYAAVPGPAPASVPTSTFNTDWAVAIGLAALGVVVALVALLRRPKPPMPPAPWQEKGASGTPEYLEDPKNVADGAAKGQAQE